MARCFFFSSRRRHTSCALGTGVQTCALPICRDSNGEPVFAAGAARVMRFDSDVTFAPVPSAADVFVVGGNSLSTGLRDSAAAVAANDKAGMNASLGALANATSHVAAKHAKIGLAGRRLDRRGARQQDVEG